MLDTIDELHQRHIIREQQAETFDFSHDRIRDVAYAEISQTRRRVLHRRVAQALEMVYHHELDEHSGELAEHFEQAGNLPKATDYLQKAGEQAAAQFANDRAVEYFTRALDTIADNELLKRVEILLARAQLYYILGLIDERKADLLALRELSTLLQGGSEEENRAIAQILIRWTEWYRGTADYTDALALAQQAIQLANAINDVALEAEAFSQLGSTYFEQGNMNDTLEAYEQAHRRAQEAKNRRLEANALDGLSAIAMFTGGKFGDIMAYLEQAMSINQALNDLEGQQNVHHKIGYALIAQGEDGYLDAEAHTTTAIRITRQLGYTTGVSQELRNLGWLYTLMGRYTEADVLLHQACRELADIDVTFAAVAQSYLGYNHFQIGDWDNAQEHLAKALAGFSTTQPTRPHRTVTLQMFSLLYWANQEHETALDYARQALQAAEPRHDHRHIAAAQSLMGYAHLGLEELEEAEACFTKARQLRLEMEQFNRSMEPLAGLAQIALLKDELNLAKEYVSQILDHLATNNLNLTEEAFQVYLVCYRVLARMDDPRSVDLCQRAYQQLETRANSLQTDEQRQTFWAVPGHQEILAARESLQS